MMTMTFSDATKEFQRFLVQQGRSPKLVWVFREDVFLYPDALDIRWPLPANNTERAQQLYESGQEQGLGVALEALCEQGKVTCCYVFVPADKTEAECALLSGLKFSILTTPIPTRKVWLGILSSTFSRPVTLSPYRHFADAQLPKREAA